MRALRIAKYFPKAEVLFWECDDPEFIQEYGYHVQKTNSYLVDPADIHFPEGVETIIFADLPSNVLYNYAVYVAALKQKKKIVICEQIYRRGQMDEGVFKEFATRADLFLVNSLSFFKTEESRMVKLLPPQIELEVSEDVKEQVKKNLGIRDDAFVIFGAGYHEGVLKKIEKLTEKLNKKKLPFVAVISGGKEQKEAHKKGNILYLPFQSGEEYFKLLYTADLVLVKFGFLQILEALAFHKPTIVLGEGGYVLRTPEVLDEALQEVLVFDDEISKSTLSYIEKLITDKEFYDTTIHSLRELHDGEAFGAQKAANAIQKLHRRTVSQRMGKRKIVLLINDEIIEKKEWLKREKRVPLETKSTTQSALSSR